MSTPRKNDVNARIEEMAAQREERRLHAIRHKQQRAADAIAAEAYGGLDSLAFLSAIRDYRELHGIGTPEGWPEGSTVWRSESGSSTRVCVRVRPMLAAEISRLDFEVVSSENHRAVAVHVPRVKVDLTKAIESHCFGFDGCFNAADGNDAIYAACVQPLVAHVFSGGYATCFAFGQTGSGKTCTMAGHGNPAAKDGNEIGIYALAADDVMQAAGEAGFAVRVGLWTSDWP
jgi:chromosomal replication initiation ATPase DnaA